MIQVSAQELSKISQFIAGCNDMANGKFILADIKITKLLNMIANSQELYGFIKECLTDYDFSREFHRAEIKNRLNNGAFAVPSSTNLLVAFVFCLLVECDAKRIDFYNFINENFPSASKSESYKKFSENLILPFSKIISSHFMFEEDNSSQISELTQSLKNDLQQEPIFEKSQYVNDTEYQNKTNYNNVINNETILNLQNYQNNASSSEIPQTNDKTVWDEIGKICDNVISSVYTERKLREYVKEEFIYILKTIKYSVKYKDVKIISALVTAFDSMSKKYKSIQFVFGELKNKLQDLYN